MNYRLIINLLVTIFMIIIVALVMFLEPINTVMNFLSVSNGIWNSASPVSGNRFVLKGLHNSVEIIIDNRGVPHIYAKDDYDLFYAIGFMHARERLWQMDIQRRFAEGRLAEIIGKSALNNDVFMRIIGLGRAANLTALMIQNNYPSYYKLYEAYADGVNAYIRLAEQENKLPLMFRLLDYKPDLWTPVDSIAFAKLMAWSLTNYFEPLKYSLIVTKIGSAEMLKLYPIYPYYEENVTVVPGNGTINNKKINVSPEYLLSLDWFSQWATGLNFNDPIFKDKLVRAVNSILKLSGDPIENSQDIQTFENLLFNGLSYSIGSNDWAVASFKSANGFAMLADDPHLQLQLPSLWYEVDLHSSDINAYGVTLVGIPAIIIGFNNKIAWGLTNTQIGVLDFYVEKINPSNPDEYWYNGSWHEFSTIREVIKVKGNPSTVLLVNETIHGPILTQEGLTISARWIGMGATYEAIAIPNVMKAQNITQFFNALRLWDVPSQNFMYADVYGNIAVIEPGKFPFRIIKLPNGDIIKVLGSRSVLNGTGDYEWAGFVQFEDLPHSVNPQQGYLAAPNQMSIGRYYPYFILGGWWDPGARAQTINMLLSKRILSVEDMMRAQSSIHDWYAQMFTPLIIKSVEKYPSNDPDVNRAIQLLKNWNYSMSKDLEAPSVWWFWLVSFYNMTFIKKYKELGIPINQYPYPGTILYLALNEPNSQWFDGDFYKTASQALQDAVKNLKTKLGASWKWGQYHMLYLEHLSQLKPLSIGPLPEDGDSFTLMAAPFSNTFYGPVKHGPSWRMIVIMNNKTGPEAYGVYPGGQSENPISKHYNDFVTTWLSYQYNNLLLENNPNRIPSNIISEIITLEPANTTLEYLEEVIL